MPRQPLAIGQHGTIRIRKVGDVWRAATYVRDADGVTREVKRQAPTKSRANKALQDALADRPGTTKADITADTRLLVVAERWLGRIADQVAAGERAPNTHRVYDNVWARHIGPVLGQLRIREATTSRLDDFIAALRTRHSASTAKTARTILNGVLGHAVRADAIRYNPMRDVSPIQSKRRTTTRALTAAERAEWLQRLDNDYLALHHDIPELTRFLLATGTRIGEALAVTFADVDFAAHTVRVDWTIVRVRGQGLQRTPTKTAAGQRTLRLPPHTMQMLEDRLRRVGEGPVFPVPRGTSWRDPSNTARAFRDARRRAGYDWVTPHTFRRTVATVLDEAGLSGRQVADQLGHSRVSMTQDVYMGRQAAGDDRTVAALQAILEP